MQPAVSREVPIVTFFVVAAPGVDPASVQVEPSVQVLGWKFAEIDKPDLIDTIAQVDKHLKALEKWCEAARGTLKQTLPVPQVAGEQTVTTGRLFQAEFKRTDRLALNQEKIKARYASDPEWCKEYMQTTPVLTLRIVPVTQTPGAAQPATQQPA